MRNCFGFLRGLAAVVSIGAVVLGGLALAGQAQGAPAQTQKQVKDQGEYDLFSGVTKEADPGKKLALLNTWKEKYPDSNFKAERSQFLLQTYAALQQWQNVIATAGEILAADAKDVQALYWIAYLAPVMQNSSPASLSSAESAAHGLLVAERPASAREADWAGVKKSLETVAHKSLGWIAVQRKNQDAAEAEFTKCLQLDPNQAEVSYWLGGVLVAEKKPELYSAALYHFARAAAYDGPGALAPQGRQQVDAYFTRIFNNYHGQDDTALAQLKQTARQGAFPPAGFQIKSSSEIATEKEEELKRSNPELALWLSVKARLTDADGEQYFESNVKDADLPKFKGTVLSAKPASNSRELVLALADDKTPEVTLKLDQPLLGKPEIGGTIGFQGVPKAFTKEPFQLVFDVEKSRITGLKVEAPPRRPGAPAKKAAEKND